MDMGHSLSRSAVFQDIGEETVAGLCSCGRQVSYEAGHHPFERGQEAEELMILEEGLVELFFPIRIMGVTREVTLEDKKPGDVVAWSAMVHPYRFTLSARCAGNCVVTCLRRDALYKYFQTDPRAGYLVMRNMAGVIGRRLQGMQTVWMRDLESRAIQQLE